ncbi:unnamed protein product [Cylindrotheca closterium]|uniref:GINS subunit domain-containing protein n=1 Tax=Cylindrotheca closterium TaxID=2856 RepID=A0AAD2CK05_9STRA|nr:unnamed protein product [Cylindrotheca closterium]
MASLTSSSRPASIPSSGKELMLELKRTTNITSNTDGGGDFLAPYNAQLVRKCFQDVQRSFQTLREEMQAVQMQGGGSGGGGGGESKSQDYNDNNSDNEEDEDDDDDVENNNSNNNNANTNANTNEKKPSMSARPSILLHNATIERQKRCLLTYHKHRMDRIQDMVANNNSGQQEDNLFSQHNNAHEAEFANDYQQLREQYASEYGLELNILPPTSHMVQVKVVEDLLTKLGGPVVLDSGRSVSLTKGSRWYLPRSDVLEYLQAGSMELCDGEEVDF